MADFQVLGVGQPAPKKPHLRPSHYQPPPSPPLPPSRFLDTDLPIDVRSLSSLYLNDNPQFQELKQRLVDYYRDSLKPVSQMHRDKSRQWRIVLYTSLHKLLREVVSAHDKQSQERCLERVYKWYYEKIQRPQPKGLDYSPLPTQRLLSTTRSLSPAPTLHPISQSKREASLRETERTRPVSSFQKTAAEDREDAKAFMGADISKEDKNDYGTTFIHCVPFSAQEDVRAENRFQAVIKSTQSTDRVLTAMREHVHTWTFLKARHEEELTLRTEGPRLLAQRPATSLPRLAKPRPQSKSHIRSATPVPVIDLTTDPGGDRGEGREVLSTAATPDLLLRSESPGIQRENRVAMVRKLYGRVIDSQDNFSQSQKRFEDSRSEEILLSGYSRRALEASIPRSDSVPRSRPILTGGLSIVPRPLSEERVSQLSEVGEVKHCLAKFGIPCRYESLTAALLIPEDLPTDRLTSAYLPAYSARMMKNPFLKLRDKKTKKGKRGKRTKRTA